MSRINNPKYLRLFYPLNNHLDDISGFGVQNTATGTSFTDIQGSSGLLFDAASDLLEVDYNLDIESGFTCTLIFQPAGNAFSGGKHALIQQIDGTGIGRLILGHRDSEKTFDTFLGGAANTGTRIISDGEIVHAAISVASNGDIKIYVNGELDLDTNVTLESNIASFHIGANKGNTSEQVNGIVKNVRLYQAVLTPTEIKQLYKLDTAKPNQPTATQLPRNTLPDVINPALYGSYFNKQLKGNIFSDYSNNNNQLTLATANASDVYSIEDTGVSFYNRTRFITPSINTAVTPRLTVTGWVSPLSITNNNNMWRFLGKGVFAVAANTNVLFNFLDTPTGITANVQPRGWRFYCFSYDANTSVAKLYIDGNLVHTGISTATGNASFEFGPTQISTDTFLFRDNNMYTEIKSDDWIREEYSRGNPNDDLVFELYNNTDVSIKQAELQVAPATVLNRSTLAFAPLSGEAMIQRSSFDTLDSQNLTYVTWVKKYAADVENTRLFDRGTLICVARGSTGRIEYSTVSTPANSITVNMWHHVTITVNGTSVSIYVDGVLKASGTTSEIGSGDFYIGNRPVYDRTLNGEVSQFRIFSGVKSPEWIKQDYLKTRKYY